MKKKKVSNAYSAHHKNKGSFKKSKGPKINIDISEIKCYNCHNMVHYKSDCIENPRNKKREREYENIADEGPPKKKKKEEYEVKDLFLWTLRDSILLL